MEIKENQYIVLKVNLGALGELELLVFENTNNEKNIAFNVSVKQLDRLKQCGAGWINTKKQSGPSLEMEHKPE